MSKVKCTHCQLEFPQDVMIKEKDKDTNEQLYFCCNGCQGVYHLLKDDGLDSFYDKVGNNTLSQPIAIDEDSSNFDMDSFRQRYIKTTPDGFSRVDLIIEGIHCAACIWLNEKVLDDTDGIVEASINFTNNKAKIVWDEDIIKLSSIIDKIRSIGYNAYPYERTQNEQKATKNQRDYFLRLSVAIFASINIMMIGVAKYAGFFTGMDQEELLMVHVGEFIFSTPVLFYSGWIFFRGAYYGLKNKIINMDFLVSTGATLTYIYSMLVMFGANGHSYFDSVAMIITFVLVGKYLEVLGKKGAMDTMDKIKAQIPIEATIIQDNVKKVIPIDQVQVGDIIEVANGQKASVDGVMLDGYQGMFDESSLSGESIPVPKKPNDKIYSGTINVAEVIRYKAIKNYANSTLNSIVELLEDALNSKPQIEDTTNELSKYFSIVILSLAMISAIAWYLYTSDFEKAFIIAVSVIVIACPCALALATPIASLVGVSWLSKEGILFKEAKFLETFSKTNTIVFDKTGTLTKGKLEVIDTTNKHLPQEIVDIIYSLANSSTHPVSVAVCNYLQTHYTPTNIQLQNIKQIPAKGMSATYKEKQIFGGKLDNNNDTTTTYHFTIDNKTIVSFMLEDTIKDGAKQTVQFLKKQNITPILCSGDNKYVTEKIAKLVGIEQYKANMSPIDKANFITSLKEQNKIVVMVGDGINDTLALSKADVSIAMGKGTDVAIAVSDIVILNDQIDGIQKAIFISKRTFKFIKQNLALSLVYNSITIPIAIAGYVIPLFAALSMSLSSLIVVGNSMRIKTKIQ
jgi:Cu+-exporting ATPase